MKNENITINGDLLIELLKLSKPFETKDHNCGPQVNGQFVHSLANLLQSKNEDFDSSLFINKVANKSNSAYEDEMKEVLLKIIKADQI